MTTQALQEAPAAAKNAGGFLSALDRDIADIAVPMLVALAADPIAGLVDTAIVGRLGAVQLAGMAV